MKSKNKNRKVIPGFGLTMGFTMLYLSLIVLLPIAAVVIKTLPMGWEGFWASVTTPRVLASYRITFGASLVAALINLVFGVLTAWVLIRYEFPGKKIIDALVDLPFALPTAVAGITLCTIYAPNGFIGKPFLFFNYENFPFLQYLASDPDGLLAQIFTPEGIKISYTALGIVIALTFIGLPFVVRTVQPVLEDLDTELEEAASSLGANRWQTVTKVILPELLPSIVTGFTLAFARAVGEFGSVVFIAGNMPMKTEITPLLIIMRLEEYDYQGATALGFSMLVISFVFLLAVNALQIWSRRRSA